MALSSVSTRAQANAINDHFLKVFSGVGTADLASVASGASGGDTMALPGVILGDIVLGVSASVAVPAGAVLSADVTAADVVTIKLVNNSGGAVDLASATFRVVLARLAAFPNASGL